MAPALIIALIAMATYAGVLVGREEDAQPQSRRSLGRAIAYQIVTVIVAFELAAGGLWDLLRIDYVRAVFAHLGYPLYLLIILGAWKIPGAVAILVPRFPRLKEWTYAGIIFNYTGAAASHFSVGDGARQWIGPLMFTAFALTSWTLRPASRRLSSPPGPADIGITRCGVAIGTVAAMLVVAYFTLPQGTPGQ